MAATPSSGDVTQMAGWIRHQVRGLDLAVLYLGRQPYRLVWELQKQLHTWRVVGEIPDVALLLEHEPVYTLGKNADERNLLASRPANAEVVVCDRGGEVTYHGPGQLVGYPIINLRECRPSVTWYIRRLEDLIIRTLATFGITAVRISGLPGVWIGQQKVAALGVRLARWTTMHGFAINVSVPRRYLEGMIPCGISEYGITNLNDCLQEPVGVQEVSRRLIPLLQGLLGRGNGQISRLNLDPTA
ncbi:MAG: lipoyl(octanoyl) transferase LipB [Fidelibacterota bacterium]|nr:MAG: lipoyl(octanoyl) transferase LipB [Candidatus Neomarinimicrobiota bacterium]